jgi:hypothetical protein
VQAIRDLDTTLLVEAAAGTGTESPSNAWSPRSAPGARRSIDLAVTFTIKAAELAALPSRLEEAARDADAGTNATLREDAHRGVLGALDTAFVGTTTPSARGCSASVRSRPGRPRFEERAAGGRGRARRGVALGERLFATESPLLPRLSALEFG